METCVERYRQSVASSFFGNQRTFGPPLPWQSDAVHGGLVPLRTSLRVSQLGGYGLSEPVPPVPLVLMPPELVPPELMPPELMPPELMPPELMPPELMPPELAPPALMPPELAPP